MDQNTQATQLDRLKALQANPVPKSNMSTFIDLIGVYLGTPPNPHFPKVKDESGKALKGADGKDLRSETSDGLTYTFAEFSTCKMIKVVLPQEVPVKLLAAYRLGGKGYDIKGSMYFIELDGSIKNY